LRKNNPSYTYEFYDDKRASDFILEAYGNEISALFNRINIGAAKADFFRYAILYKKGGVYLDIDSLITSKIDDFIKPEDVAVISNESNLNFFLQYVLFFEPQHPILKRTMDLMISNLKQNTYPYDTHKMTGPTVFTKAIKDCMTKEPKVGYRILGIDFDDKVKFSFRGSKTFLYGLQRKIHWKKLGNKLTVMSAK
jgi:mannosyltransferase OCH1-like enzyme